MSKSYKHTPRCGQKKSKFFKKQANRKLRHIPLEEPPYNNKSYRRVYCTWNICDYQWVGTSFEQYWLGLLKMWHKRGKHRNEPYPDREEAYQEYCRFYIRK
jgi:hypothetical protein